VTPQPWPQSQDLQNREVRQQRFAHFTELAIMSVQEIVDFAKQLPGFLELTREDQIALLKTSTIEVCSGSCLDYVTCWRWTGEKKRRGSYGRGKSGKVLEIFFLKCSKWMHLNGKDIQVYCLINLCNLKLFTVCFGILFVSLSTTFSHFFMSAPRFHKMFGPGHVV